MIVVIAIGLALLAGSPSAGRHKSGATGSRHRHYVPSIHYTAGADVHYNAHSKRLVFGLTRQQVRRLVGTPEKVLRYQGLLCWQYQVNAVWSTGYVDKADRLCFEAGSYTQRFIQGAGGAWNAY
ncbi:MAG TPA: hypothetical protein VFA97_10340 [Gaiellaceae bacterium]|nr:hypothetical protein [Gaiellaceae bacterium]